MSAAAFDFGNVGHPAATLPRTSPAKPGYVRATQAYPLARPARSSAACSAFVKGGKA
jgi:hypothetical protein